MWKILLGVGIPILAGVAFFYTAMFLIHHETKVSDGEILIERVGANPFNNSRYAVNLRTGEEKIRQFSMFGKSRYIDYERECQCITRVHVIGDYSVSILSDGQARYRSGRTVHKIVPYEQVSHIFEDALVIRNKFKEKYADILSR